MICLHLPIPAPAFCNSRTKGRKTAEYYVHTHCEIISWRLCNIQSHNTCQKPRLSTTNHIHFGIPALFYVGCIFPLIPYFLTPLFPLIPPSSTPLPSLFPPPPPHFHPLLFLSSPHNKKIHLQCLLCTQVQQIVQICLNSRYLSLTCSLEQPKHASSGWNRAHSNLKGPSPKRNPNPTV